MRTRGASMMVCLSFVSALATMAGCPVARKDSFPPDVDGGSSSSTMASGGMGGKDGAGGTGGATCTCNDDGNPCTEEKCDSEGRCQHVARPAGSECHDVHDGNKIVCDDKSTCVSCLEQSIQCNGKCRRCIGLDCTEDDGCASNHCIGRMCRLGEGEDCEDDVQCATNFCNKGNSNKGKCSICSDDQDCAGVGGRCVQHACRAAIGQPCGSNALCVDGASCLGNGLCMLANGEGCKDIFQCSSRRCAPGFTCEACTDYSPSTGTGTNCEGSVACDDNGICKIGLPSGSYCIRNGDCDSSLTCDGFPRKCK